LQPYDQFPGESREWVYQSNREFTSDEARRIEERASLFAGTWSAHGDSLTARVDVIYDRFIRVTVDETSAGASGCSIDKLVNFVRRLEQEYGVRLLDGMAVSYREGATITCCGRDEFQRLVQSGTVSSETIVFNNSVTTKDEFDSRWEGPITESWHREFLIA